MPPWMTADAEAPLAELCDEVVERVLELGENEQPLVGMVEETLAPASRSRGVRASLPPRFLDSLRLLGEFFEFAISSRTCSGFWASVTPPSMCSSRSRSPSSISSRSSASGRSAGRSGQSPGLLQVLRRAACARFSSERRDGVGARREAALIQGHQEADGTGARVVAAGGRLGALLLHEPVTLRRGRTRRRRSGNRRCVGCAW